jgi:class 3 adenylate cyclase
MFRKVRSGAFVRAGFRVSTATSEALSSVARDRQARFEPIGPLGLRGKTGTTEVFALTDSRVNRPSHRTQHLAD